MFNVVEGLTMDVNEAVAKGAQIFADVEEKAEEIKASLRELRSVFQAVRKAGHIGNLECLALTQSMAALGDKFAADVLEKHSLVTRRCQDLGIDLPQPRGGGDR